jgi:hypothetical protein
MLSRERMTRMIRRSQTYISVLIFTFVFLFCWKTTNLDITSIELSKWGTGGTVGILWNSAVLIFALSIAINSWLYMRVHKRLKHRFKFYILFASLPMTLALVGIFDTFNYPYIHSVAAGLYFFIYPLTIFLFAHINRKNMSYSNWLIHILLATSMAVLPLGLTMVFKGKAIAEIVHTILVIIYNIIIARHEH